jgi:CRISPR associated protein Cas2
MYILLTYDVSTVTKAGQKRLRQVAKTCLDYGGLPKTHFLSVDFQIAQVLQGFSSGRPNSIRWLIRQMEGKSRFLAAPFDISA